MADPVAPAATTNAPAAPPVVTPPADTLLTSAPPTAPAADASKPAEAAKPADVPAGAPEKYSDFTMPEGVTVDKVALDAFAPALKEANLTQDQAQKLVGIYAEQSARQATEYGAKLKDPAFATEQAGLLLAGHREAWATAVKADAEIGGTNFDANVQTAQRAVARFGTPELKSLLETTGLGNHPALVKMFVAVGKQIREDVPNYGAGGTARKSNTEVFYGGSSASGA